MLGVPPEFLILELLNIPQEAMNVSLADQGLYYRGLLILIRKDLTIDEAERSMMMRIGRALGFEESFCAQAIREILVNEYIPDDPPRFSDPEIARCFIRDGIRLALADGEIGSSEHSLLKAVSDLHGFDDAWLKETIERIAVQELNGPSACLDAEHFRWQ
jgi:hypothetical protein